jgi:hypothetical protein
VWGSQRRAGDRHGAGPADAHDADAAAPAGRCDGDDGVGGGEHGIEPDPTPSGQDDRAGLSPERRYRRVVMMTVFMNASPIDSDSEEGSSAIAMWTMRRS